MGPWAQTARDVPRVSTRMGDGHNGRRDGRLACVQQWDLQAFPRLPVFCFQLPNGTAVMVDNAFESNTELAVSRACGAWASHNDDVSYLNQEVQQ